MALGIIRTIIENKKDLKVNDLLNYSSSLYQNQGHNLLIKIFRKNYTTF